MHQMHVDVFRGANDWWGFNRNAPRPRPAFHIADDGLPTIIHMDVLDAHKLLPAVAQAAKDLNLGGISSHQPGRSRPKRRNPSLCSKTAIQLGENCHGGRVRAGHLNGERCLNFVLWRCGLDHSESGITKFLKIMRMDPAMVFSR